MREASGVDFESRLWPVFFFGPGGGSNTVGPLDVHTGGIM